RLRVIQKRQEQGCHLFFSCVFTREYEFFSSIIPHDSTTMYVVAVSTSPASIMTNRWILQAAFLLGFLPIALSINYKWLELRQRNSACRELLKQLDRQLCLKYRMNFKIPTEVLHPGQMEKKDTALVIQEMLQNIFDVFQSNSSSTGWNETIVKRFLGKLHKQMDFLKEILKEIPETESSTQRNFATILPLKSYYRSVAVSTSPASIMTNRWILQAAFLLGFLPIALSINYKWLELRQRNSACRELLKQLDRQLCLKYRMNFKIPTEVLHPGQMEKKDTALVIQEMLQNIFDVFQSNSSSTGWNETIVKRFLGKLHKQMDFLKEILKEIPETESSTQRNFATILPLKSYYRSVQRYLEDEGYSSCAWMVVRAEILRNFSMIKRLTNVFQN
ncbi:hypothetical protein A6R68_15606, partial [Neotoma lepida]